MAVTRYDCLLLILNIFEHIAKLLNEKLYNGVISYTLTENYYSFSFFKFTFHFFKYISLLCCDRNKDKQCDQRYLPKIKK